MKVTKKDIVFLIIILVMGYWIIFKKSGEDNKAQIEMLEERNKQLEHRTDSLNGVIANHQETVDWLVDSINAKDRQIEQLGTQRKNIERYYARQITELNNYTVSELDSFFIARYPLTEGESPSDSTGSNSPR